MVSTALLVLALAYWGQVPACGTPEIAVAPLPGAQVGLAEWGACRITLDPVLFRRAGAACMTTLHEYGHLLGLGHAADPDDLMYPVWQEPRWPCKW